MRILGIITQEDDSSYGFTNYGYELTRHKDAMIWKRVYTWHIKDKDCMKTTMQQCGPAIFYSLSNRPERVRRECLSNLCWGGRIVCPGDHQNTVCIDFDEKDLDELWM